ncbi:MAG TPA: hypothetical protein VGT03_11635 [Candidatus Acidoferrales bacterium]|nr:hypothetical protein [Candidatus Acidoferrales bacterium]
MSGQVRPERKLAICTGGISLTPAERAEIFTVLALDPEEGVAQRAASALLSVPAEYFLAALERGDAAPALFAYCAENLAAKPGIADALAKNPSCSAGILERAATNLTSSGIQSLLDHLDRLTASPSLISVLAASANANAEQRELLAELQKGAPAEKDLEDAVSDAVADPEKRKTLIQRLAKMNVVQRIQLALMGGREERIALIRDPNKVVQRAVLQSPRLTEAEVENFAAMTVLSIEILRQISINRLWMKNYSIVRNLTTNSKTPLDISLHLLPRLIPRDLKILATNKNVPETLRTMAAKMNVKREAGRKDS